jgi:TATA-binding protein-associated factor Taf7
VQYFDWSAEETVERFGSLICPGLVLRAVLQAALDKDSARRKSTRAASSRAPARNSGSTVVNNHKDSAELVLAIHGERSNASTDNIPEYHLEVDPHELVQRALSDIKEASVKFANTAAAEPLSDEEDSDEEENDEEDGDKEDDEKDEEEDDDEENHVWIPAVMVQHAYPELVKNFIANKAVKDNNKAPAMPPNRF